MRFDLPSDRLEPTTDRPVTRIANKSLVIFSGFVNAVLPRTCGLCGLTTARAGLCPGCVTDLPGFARARCRRCARPIRLVSGLHQHCADCQAARQTIHPSGFDRTLALADYAMPLDRLLLAAKRGGRPHLASALGSTIAHWLLPTLALPAWPDLLVPVPLADRKLRERGFNQSALMATAIARQWHLRCDRYALVRTRDTQSQQGLRRQARDQNMVAAFSAHRRVAGRRIALIDDVMTSGATAAAAAHALRQAGARSVLVIVAARTA